MAAANLDACEPDETLWTIADAISEVLAIEGSVVRSWAAAGIAVRAVYMRGRGRCEVSDLERPLVYVNVEDNAFTQHFTVAHEIAHLLLSSLPSSRVSGLSHRAEEALCDEFAQRVIVPPSGLAAALAGDRSPTPERVLRLCGHFRANPSTMLRALSEQRLREHTTYLLARLRVHPRRPGVVGFRIDSVSGRGELFWPYKTRVENVGLVNLAASGEQARHGQYIDGCEDEVIVPLSRVTPNGENVAAGPVSWLAARQGRGEPYLLARIDGSRMRMTRVKRKSGETSTSRV